MPRLDQIEINAALLENDNLAPAGSPLRTYFDNRQNAVVQQLITKLKTDERADRLVLAFVKEMTDKRLTRDDIQDKISKLGINQTDSKEIVGLIFATTAWKNKGDVGEIADYLNTDEGRNNFIKAIANEPNIKFPEQIGALVASRQTIINNQKSEIDDIKEANKSLGIIVADDHAISAKSLFAANQVTRLLNKFRIENPSLHAAINAKQNEVRIAIRDKSEFSNARNIDKFIDDILNPLYGFNDIKKHRLTPLGLVDPTNLESLKKIYAETQYKALKKEMTDLSAESKHPFAFQYIVAYSDRITTKLAEHLTPEQAPKFSQLIDSKADRETIDETLKKFGDDDDTLRKINAADLYAENQYNAIITAFPDLAPSLDAIREKIKEELKKDSLQKSADVTKQINELFKLDRDKLKDGLSKVGLILEEDDVASLPKIYADIQLQRIINTNPALANALDASDAKSNLRSLLEDNNHKTVSNVNGLVNRLKFTTRDDAGLIAAVGQLNLKNNKKQSFINELLFQQLIAKDDNLKDLCESDVEFKDGLKQKLAAINSYDEAKIFTDKLINSTDEKLALDENLKDKHLTVPAKAFAIAQYNRIMNDPILMPKHSEIEKHFKKTENKNALIEKFATFDTKKACEDHLRELKGITDQNNGSPHYQAENGDLQEKAKTRMKSLINVIQAYAHQSRTLPYSNAGKAAHQDIHDKAVKAASMLNYALARFEKELKAATDEAVKLPLQATISEITNALTQMDTIKANLDKAHGAEIAFFSTESKLFENADATALDDEIKTYVNQFAAPVGNIPAHLAQSSQAQLGNVDTTLNKTATFEGVTKARVNHTSFDTGKGKDPIHMLSVQRVSDKACTSTLHFSHNQSWWATVRNRTLSRSGFQISGKSLPHDALLTWAAQEVENFRVANKSTDPTIYIKGQYPTPDHLEALVLYLKHKNYPHRNMAENKIEIRDTQIQAYSERVAKDAKILQTSHDAAAMSEKEVNAAVQAVEAITPKPR